MESLSYSGPRCSNGEGHAPNLRSAIKPQELRPKGSMANVSPQTTDSGTRERQWLGISRSQPTAAWKRDQRWWSHSPTMDQGATLVRAMSLT